MVNCLWSVCRYRFGVLWASFTGCGNSAYNLVLWNAVCNGIVAFIWLAIQCLWRHPCVPCVTLKWAGPWEVLHDTPTITMKPELWLAVVTGGQSEGTAGAISNWICYESTHETNVYLYTGSHLTLLLSGQNYYQYIQDLVASHGWYTSVAAACCSLLGNLHYS